MNTLSPKVKVVSDLLENIANACHRCNGHKYNKIEGFDNITQQIVRLYHPRKDSWKDHFEWSENFLLIIGLTAIGRVTVDVLKLNNPKTVRMRRLLILNLEHPPKDLL